MKRNLFLTGSDTLRNSSIVRSVLNDRMAWAGGYITRREELGEDEYRYFLYPACYAAGISGLEGAEFFRFSYNGINKDMEVFRSNGTRLLEEALFYTYSIIDHFGGFEILIPEFRNALADLLNSEIPLIGVLLSPDEVFEMKSIYGLGDRLDDYINNLHIQLNRDIDTELIQTDALSDDKVKEIILNWSDTYAAL